MTMIELRKRIEAIDIALSGSPVLRVAYNGDPADSDTGYAYVQPDDPTEGRAGEVWVSWDSGVRTKLFTTDNLSVE